MKRHIQLQPLSRQHHNGLLVALLIKKGISKAADINIMAAFIIDCWQKDLQSHFLDEENFLIPALSKTAFDAALTKRLLDEHATLRSYIHSLQEGQVNISVIENFTGLLEQHIRFEERIYFAEAEKFLSEEQLEEVGKQLHEDDNANCINYPVKFWA